MTRDEIIAEINSSVYENGRQAILGRNLQSVLLNLVDYGRCGCDSPDVVTPEELNAAVRILTDLINSIVTGGVDMSEYIKRVEAEERFAEKSELDDYATRRNLEDAVRELSEAIAAIEAGDIDLDGYLTIEQGDTRYLHQSDLTPYSTKDELNQALVTMMDAISRIKVEGGGGEYEDEEETTIVLKVSNGRRELLKSSAIDYTEKIVGKVTDDESMNILNTFFPI